jgi:transcriptional regulator with XRE-family HTH domain
MPSKPDEQEYYRYFNALVNHEIDPIDFLREMYAQDMTEAAYAHGLSLIQADSSEKEILVAAGTVYDDLHKMNLLLEKMHMDEFDNFLIFMIAGRFRRELAKHPLMARKKEVDFSEEIADYVWERCKKADKYMFALKREIARSMSKAIQLRFYGKDAEKLEEITSFIETYYHAAAPVEKQFSALLNQIREKRKEELSVEEISKRSGVSRALIDAYLSGASSPARNDIFKIALGLKLTQPQLDELLNAADKDLARQPGHRSFRINRSDPRDLYIYEQLSKRLTIEEMNAQLRVKNMQILDEEQKSRAPGWNGTRQL